MCAPQTVRCLSPRQLGGREVLRRAPAVFRKCGAAQSSSRGAGVIAQSLLSRRQLRYFRGAGLCPRPRGETGGYSVCAAMG